MIPDTLAACLYEFAPCFTSPSFQRFVAMMSGWLLCSGKRTVTGVMRGAGVAERDHSGYHKFFSQAVWSPEEVGAILLSLALKMVPKEERVKVTLDDTLARHTGKYIASAGMHRDPLLSTGSRPFFHFGHCWVVVAVAVSMPWGKTFSLPCLTRLYRSEKTAAKETVAHRKKTELASEMLRELGRLLSKRAFLVFTDNAYVNRSIVRELPDNIDLVGRGRMDAALYDLPTTRKGRGRPRIKGKRVPSPAHRAQKGRWRRATVRVYGREAEVRVQVFDALWYIVGGGRLIRFVVVRDWPGHKKDDVLVSTDLSLTAEDIIEGYCERWSLEETFGWAKSRLGLEDPHNRAPLAVQRTAPMAFWSYSITVYWYCRWAQRRTHLPMRRDRWQPHKTSPSFADMLATMRRQGWTIWIFDQADHGRLDQKSLAPLLDAVGYG